jgi:hypothetical protein
MQSAMHSLIRALSTAVVIVSLPLSALVCRAMARLATHAYDDLLGGKPLPALTSFLVTGQANSREFSYTSIVIAILLAAAAAWFFRLPEANPWRATGQVLTTAVAASLTFALLASTMAAAFLPLVSWISSLRWTPNP